MTKNSINKDKYGENDPPGLSGKSSIPWNKTSDEIWLSMQEKLPDRGKTYPINRRRTILRYAVAASVIVFLGISSLMRFYSKTVETGKAEHMDLLLPDGSSLAMNAETTVKYYPMWWKFSRHIELEGEAFFEVVKGNNFVVESDRASTAVLGTSFNIFSRGSRYEVVCLTGKVAVYTPGNRSEVLLDPNQKAVLDDSGKLNADSDIEAKQSISWTDNEFFFTSAPLPLVFDEIERQYGINIIYNNIVDNLTYTGNFSRRQDIDTILDLVCKPFGIKFEMSRELTYLLSKDEYYR